MSSNLFRCILTVLLAAFSVTVARAGGYPLFHSIDSLAPRDEWGLLHQSPALDPTDFSPRHSYRIYYNFKSGRELLTDPAYVGALQACLRNRGYFCGPIDGIMSEDVSDAISRLQKNYSQRVTGTLTVPVRRVLRLP